jgi:spore coat protein U-like protein
MPRFVTAPRAILAASLVVGLVHGSVALAAAAAANLRVAATVPNNCKITTTAVAFGNYDPIVTNAATALTRAGSVRITCTKGALVTITLGLGTHASGTTRQLGVGTSRLAYALFQPSSTTPGAGCVYTTPTNWGTTGAEVFAPTAAPSRAQRTYNVCGSIAPGQDVPAGAYTDTVVATVNF